MGGAEGFRGRDALLRVHSAIGRAGARPSQRFHRVADLVVANVPCLDLPVHPRRVGDVGVELAVERAGGGEAGVVIVIR